MDSLRAAAEQIAHAGAQLDRDTPRQMWLTPIEAMSHDGRFLHVRVAPTGEQLEAHRAPGQYVVARFEDARPRFIALGSAPGSARWELIFEPKSEWDLGQFAPGRAVWLSLPEGSGYPLAPAGPVVVFATGSGVASVIPWLDAVANLPTLPQVQIFYTPSPETPQTVERLIRSARAASSDLTICEYDALLEYTGSVESGSAVFLCASPATMMTLAERLLRRGFDQAQLHTNH